MKNTERQRERRPLTPEQQAKSDARREQFKALAAQIGAMSEAERGAMAERMAGAVTIEGRSLSVHNACLLACQRAEVTLVGGFNQWKAHGRVVRKGEHGLMIWAPVRGRDDGANTPDAGEPSSDRPHFIMVTVFDVMQTDALALTGAA